jgi:dipeptidyl aminopeptidase/acylaminoacyl peptidase
MRRIRKPKGLLAVAVVVVMTFMALRGVLAQGEPGPGLVVFASNLTGNYEIYVLNPATGLSTQLTNNTAQDIEPMWSPDGSKIAFASDRDGDYEIYVMRLDGTDVRQLTNNLAEDRQPRWQPDGNNIIFVSNVNGQWDLYSISADGAIVRQLTNDAADERGPGFAATASGGVPVGPTPAVVVTVPSALAVDGKVNSYQLNLRMNPGEGSRIIEVLPRDTPLDILGRYYDNNWIQVQTPTGNVGWVAAWLVDVYIDLSTVPIINVQFISPPPTATPTPAATATPVITTTISFWTDKGEIKSGKCATIGWDLEGISQVYYEGAGVTGHETRKVCPTATTDYHLHIVLPDGSTTDRTVTIKVTAP